VSGSVPQTRFILSRPSSAGHLDRGFNLVELFNGSDALLALVDGGDQKVLDTLGGVVHLFYPVVHQEHVGLVHLALG